MPDVKVFISATRQDLDDTCLRAVKAAFDRRRDAASVDMETWTAHHGRPVDVCIGQIRQWSTHYIGIFAYRLGWTPDEDLRSITQIEFEEAQRKYGENSHQIQVFVPCENSEISVRLRQRVGEQTEEEQAAQERFLKRVRSQVYMAFHDEFNLRDKVEDSLQRWADPRSLTDLSGGGEIPASKRAIDCLGLDDQVHGFKRALQAHSGEAESTMVFVVHGPGGFGHGEAARELARVLDSHCNGKLKRLVCDLGDTERDGVNEKNIVHGLARCLQLDLSRYPKKGVAVANVLGAELLRHDVLIDVGRVDRYRGGLSGFLTFWRKLLAAIPDGAGSSFDLIAVLAHEGPVDGDDYLDSPVTVLPPLEPIAQGVLTEWLRAWVPDRAARKAKATEILLGTRGVPDSVRARLRDPDTWALAMTPADDDFDGDDEEEGMF